jgi:hypothetical protein
MAKNSKITRIPLQDETSRIRTGAIQFNDDWPGLFIRGDEAFALMLELKQMLKALEEEGNQEYPAYVAKSIVSVIAQDVIVRSDS